MLWLLLVCFQMPNDGKDDSQWLQLALQTGGVNLQPGTYTLEQPVVVEAESRTTSIVMRGDGRYRTSLVVEHGEPVALHFKAEDRAKMFEYCQLRGFSFTTRGRNDVAIRIDTLSHSSVEDVRIVGGNKAALSVGYNWSNNFEKLLLQLGGVGLHFTDPVNNHNRLDSVMVLSNGVGLRLDGGFGITLSGCGFEANRALGLMTRNVNGLSIQGGYVEGNAKDGYVLDGETRYADMLLNGYSPDLHVTAPAYPTQGVSIRGVGGTKRSSTVEDVIVANANNFQIQPFGVRQ